jgi:hypothetical protein
MKPLVFMCLVIVGTLVGLYLGINTYERSYKASRTERAKYVTLFTLAGAAVGGGLGWVACNIERLGKSE